MKKFLVSSCCLAAVALWGLSGTPVSASGGEDAGPVVTLKGEVVDMHCYLTGGAKGAKHAKCATNCIKKGIPAGFLANGKLYILLSGSHGPAGPEVAKLAGKQISLTGRVINSGGLKAFQLEKN